MGWWLSIAPHAGLVAAVSKPCGTHVCVGSRHTDLVGMRSRCSSTLAIVCPVICTVSAPCGDFTCIVFCCVFLEYDGLPLAFMLQCFQGLVVRHATVCSVFFNSACQGAQCVNSSIALRHYAWQSNAAEPAQSLVVSRGTDLICAHVRRGWQAAAAIPLSQCVSPTIAAAGRRAALCRLHT